MSSASEFVDRPDRVARLSIFRRFISTPSGAIALAVFLLVVAVALLAPWISPQDPNYVDLANTKAPPSAEHWLGGDTSGRDVLSRLIWGAQTTLLGAAITIMTAALAGIPTGIAAGYFGGSADRGLSWLSDAVQAIPGMIILLVVAAGTRSNFVILMATVGVFMAPGYFRIARSTTMTIAHEPYIDAARVAGLGNTRIIFRHIFPGIYAPIIIQTALAAGISMGIQAGLQFLGVGSSNTPSWGAMMNEGFRFMLTNPLLLLWPSAALGVTIAALAIMGSTLADLVRMKAPVQSRGAASRLAAMQTPSSENFVCSPEACAVRIEELRVFYGPGIAEKEVVKGISFDVRPGEVLGIVGESGSGKSQTVFSLLDLLPQGGRYEAKGLWVSGRPVHVLSARERTKLLGSEIAYIPQEPMSNLDPSFKIGHQLTEPLRHTFGKSRAEADRLARALLARVGIADVDRVMQSYPHQISGGMAQRVLIAGAISGKPSVLLADEPTTALDVTVQAEVLELLRELQEEFGMALVLVTHNFGVVADICDRVIVMREGIVVETGEVNAIFDGAKQPYTRELIAATLDDCEGRRELDAIYHSAGNKERHYAATGGGKQ
jgi:ABC-type dipeptide/oligopeptide/nickel transport system ATPase component/ABC-type dipeptide/oligopeptide/nickel transport system permease subunit|tara:strand:- start:82313 stop:84127 length:1815 start_codon:yes stop_codon:yes gene_type:complete